MLMGSKHIRQFCKECGSVSTIQRRHVIVSTNPFKYPITIQLTISVLVILILGLVKSHI